MVTSRDVDTRTLRAVLTTDDTDARGNGSDSVVGVVDKVQGPNPDDTVEFDSDSSLPPLAIQMPVSSKEIQNPANETQVSESVVKTSGKNAPGQDIMKPELLKIATFGSEGQVNLSQLPLNHSVTDVTIRKENGTVPSTPTVTLTVVTGTPLELYVFRAYQDLRAGNNYIRLFVMVPQQLVSKIAIRLQCKVYRDMGKGSHLIIHDDTIHTYSQYIHSSHYQVK